MARQCPECGRGLRVGQQGCRCGWTELGGKPPPDPDCHRCAYRNGQRRCPLPGVSTDAVRPDAHTRWYCRWHLATLSDPIAAAQVLDDLDRNGAYTPPPDWRESAIQAGIERLGLRKRPGESAAAFIARCKAALPAYPLELSAARQRPSRAERVESLVDRFAEHVARLTADGVDPVKAERIAAQAMAETVLAA